jgi:threonine synthase
MRYISTRGLGPVSFTEAMLAGLASDGGLFVPESYPDLSACLLHETPTMGWHDIAVRVMAPFVAPDLSDAELADHVAKAYAAFPPEVTPLQNLGDDGWLLELFHGPTLAFKDVALQLLGRLLDDALRRRGGRVTVLGATSGDTGPAAIEGLRHSPHVRIVMLFPHGRVSEVQRRQMTTLGAANVHPVAVDGTFDDAQDIVKALFNRPAFRAKHQLTAINSISWARLLPQMVYYVYAWSRVSRHGEPVAFSVPTGNFGDVFAGYVAARCGLPVAKLRVATNSNDILARFFTHGDYSRRPVVPTQSPSMDIQVASNFERLLFDACTRDATRLKGLMDEFRATGALPSLADKENAFIGRWFDGKAVTEDQTTATMARLYAQHRQLVDPHTAVGLQAARDWAPGAAKVTLATAHPAKFPDAVAKATGVFPALPPHLADLHTRPETFTVCPATPDAVADLMEALP